MYIIVFFIFIFATSGQFEDRTQDDFKQARKNVHVLKELDQYTVVDTNIKEVFLLLLSEF